MTVKKVTQEQVDAIIAQSSFEVFHRIHGKQCIVVAKLPNGFTVVGESACVDPTNYDEQIGFNLAVKHIKERLWELEGYALQNKLYLEDLLGDFVEQVEMCDFRNKNGWELKENLAYKKLIGMDISQTHESFTTAATLHPGEIALPSTALHEGHVRYSCTTYVGEVSEDLTVEGSPDDVIKVLGKVKILQKDTK